MIDKEHSEDAETLKTAAEPIGEAADVTYDHVIKYTGLFGGVQGITMLASVVRNKIVSVLLGPSGLALINIYNTVVRFLNDSTNLGISFSAVKHLSELYEKGNKEEIEDNVVTIRTWCLLTGLFGCLLCMAFSPLISHLMLKDYAHAWAFLCLAPCVLMMAVTGGELAILKSLRRLKTVAVANVFCALAALLISAPIYILFRAKGIVPSLLLINFAIMSVNLYFCNKIVRWKVDLRSRLHILKGMPMVRLGIAYILAGVFGQGAELVIRALLVSFGGDDGLDNVGFYQSGYSLAVSYASMVFIAIEADYFPRLSGACGHTKRMSSIINQQIEVCVLLTAPLLILLVMFMPIIVHVLYAKDFVAAEPMAVSASFYMFFRALTLPVAYLPLARGDSKMYLLTEFICDVFMAFAIPLSFKFFGLVGAGFALSATGLLDFLIIHLLYRKAYQFAFSFRLVWFYILQFILLATSILTALADSGLVKWIVCALTFSLSFFISVRILRRETKILTKLWSKIKDKLHRK